MMDWDEPDQPRRSAQELGAGLWASWRPIAESLARWTPADLAESFTTPRGETFTRQWVIWHVIEHDLHHGGELYRTLGTHGLPTPELQRRSGPGRAAHPPGPAPPAPPRVQTTHSSLPMPGARDRIADVAR